MQRGVHDSLPPLHRIGVVERALLPSREGWVQHGGCGRPTRWPASNVKVRIRIRIKLKCKEPYKARMN